ncbi:ABC transporter substrate-binding protein [Arthrobacter sp. B0490]|uniref:ABC transporter substrate-binding protein n=1 Tax=Arthrobacter sp. B0490 TaxID=2058891 RepID=UPI0011AFF125|nr:ABC transporter substrate-binding protein [Arthrobacter sp. B0490]
MPEAVDVGSVLGGRYKVTAYVLASAERDLVLDGVDQVLNRPVSILVASVGNASQVAESARELATGDRSGNIQVLDLGITESGTYLVTNRAPAADMLDLIVQQEAPARDTPYIEPFFTDTLGSEIFGGPRSTEPEIHDDDEDYDDARHHRKPRLSGLTRRFGRQNPEDAPQDETSDLPPVVAERRPNSHLVPPPPSRRPGGASPAVVASAPGHGDSGQARDGDRSRQVPATAATAVAAGTAAAVAVPPVAAQRPARAASLFPQHQDDPEHDDIEHDDIDRVDAPDPTDDDGGGRKFTRVLVGVVLSVVLVVAVVLAATQLGSLFGGSTLADTGADQATSAPATEEPTTAPTAEPSAEPVVEPVVPVVSGITRVVPDNQALDAANDATLPLIIDGNPATFWGNQVYASDTFGGLASSLALVVELEEESEISEVSIDQLNGAGGSFSVLVNDQPNLEGAQQIAQSGFTAPTVTLPIPAGTAGPQTGRYVIVNFTQLPRLFNIQAQYPFGLRIAEIRVG